MPKIRKIIEIKKLKKEETPDYYYDNRLENKGEFIPPEEVFSSDSPIKEKNIENIYNPKKKDQRISKKITVAGFSAVIIILAIILGFLFLSFKTYYFFKNYFQPSEKDSISSAIFKEEEKKSASGEANRDETKKPEEISVEKPPEKETKILVLNGGAPAGSAAKTKATLEKSGYLKVEASNSEEQSISGEKIYYQENYLTEAQNLAKTLKTNYPQIEVKPAESEEQKKSVLVIILGK